MANSYYTPGGFTKYTRARAEAIDAEFEAVEDGFDLVEDAINNLAAVDSSLRYTFSTSTSMGDPGDGVFRFNSATVSSVTAIAIDATSENTGNPNVLSWITSWDDSSSTIKGELTFAEIGSPQNFAIFHVTALTDNTGWVQVTVTHVASAGSFGNGDSVSIKFSRSGDVGDMSLQTTSVATAAWVKDEDDMASDSASHVPTQQSVKAYVTSQGGAPAGAVFSYAGTSEPTGYLFANGQAVSRTTYSTLFSVIGTTYGSGNGSTTFNVPDLRGRSIFGDDDMGSTASGRIATDNELSNSGGEDRHTLTTTEMPAHTHTGSTNSGGSHTHSYNDEGIGTGTRWSTGSGLQDFDNGRTTGSSGSHSHSFTTNSSGSGGAHNNMPPYLVLNWIIKT